jgi:hypothetical protein
MSDRRAPAGAGPSVLQGQACPCRDSARGFKPALPFARLFIPGCHILRAAPARLLHNAIRRCG